MTPGAAADRPRLHVEATGHGPRLVLCHGFTQTGRSWGPVAADLATDHEVLTVDLPGHGGSGEVVADLPATADLVAAAGREAVYVGYSLGGRVALHVALRHPSMVRALVVLGATGGLDAEQDRAARRATDEALAARIESIGVDAFLEEWLAQPLFATLPHDAATLADRRRNTPAGLAASLRHAGTGAQAPLWGAVRDLATPTLVLAGEHDQKFRAAGARLADTIGRQATLALVPGAGHAAHLEQPAAFVSIVRAWLATIEG